METINYKNLEWYVINETDKEKLLFLKDCLTHEQLLKYFKGTVYIDENETDIQFNDNRYKIWWKNSIIRSVLNFKFLNALDINDLNVMETTVKLVNDVILGKDKVTTKDYVRLITKEEVEVLDRKILYTHTSEKHGYWTMSPYGFYNINNDAEVFSVKNDYISSSTHGLYKTRVDDFYGVRPVISLKKKVLDSGLILSDEEEMIKELKRAIKL